MNMYKNKQYLDTWLICILFALWFLIIPAIVGLVFLVMQIIENKKLVKQYGEIDTLQEKIAQLETTYQNEKESLSRRFDENRTKMDDDKKTVQNNINNLLKEKQKLENEIVSLEQDAICKHYNFSDYSGLTSEECKNQLSLLKMKEQDAIKNQELITVTSTNTKTVINSNVKQILRCFNSECDNILLGLSNKNIDTSRNKLTKSFETLNKIFSVDGVQLKHNALDMKLEQLNLVYSYELKRAQEIEIQKEIKAQMVEEEKVRREIEKQKAKITKDEKQISGEVNRLMKYMQKAANDIEKNLYLEKIQELEQKLQELAAEKESVLEREANAKAGFVYIISNIGSFGEDVYKIGMTRRLEPMDSIKELSSASVPFEFDVHAMIFSENAPELETTLHKHFESRSVNKVNLRKEFFKVSLDEIEKVVTQNYNKTVEFTRIPIASEYRQTLNMMNSKSTPASSNINDADRNFQPSDTKLNILNYIKTLIDSDNLIFKKSSDYTSIQIGQDPLKWICRIYFQEQKNLCVLHKFGSTNYECEYYFDDPTQLSQIKNLFKDVLNKCTSF